MTVYVYKNDMNYALAIKNRLHSDFNHNIINDKQHKCLLSLAKRAII